MSPNLQSQTQSLHKHTTYETRNATKLTKEMLVWMMQLL